MGLKNVLVHVHPFLAHLDRELALDEDRGAESFLRELRHKALQIAPPLPAEAGDLAYPLQLGLADHAAKAKRDVVDELVARARAAVDGPLDDHHGAAARLAGVGVDARGCAVVTARRADVALGVNAVIVRNKKVVGHSVCPL